MSGLCGWWGQAAQADAAPLAAALSRLDGAPVQQLAAGGHTVAVAASPGAAHCYQHDGLLVAVWGRPHLDGCSDDGAGAGHDVGRQPLAHRLALLWRARGPLACQALSGPFALAILDTAAGEALLAVDRTASLPLCHGRHGGALYFASSLAAAGAMPGTLGMLDAQALYSYLFFHMVPAPHCVLPGWQRLLPGQYLHSRQAGCSVGSYWSLRFQENRRVPFASGRQELLRLLREAVGHSLGESPERCGAFLSGGTDSSTVAALACQVGGQPLRTYSIGFDAPGYDEMDYARLAARRMGSRHHEYYVTPDDVLAAIPAMAAAFDQPFGNASAVAAYYCARMARADGVTRLLGGDGGDELFGGNTRYAHQARLSRYERLPAVLRQGCLEPLLFRHRLAGLWQVLDKARRYIEQATMPLPVRLENYNLLLHHGPRTVLCDDFLASVDTGGPIAMLTGAWWQRPEKQLSQINALLALDMRFTLADNDLPKVRVACEAAGVEAAFPLLHDGLLAFAAQLAPQDKLDGTRLRPFFKRALAEVLPRAIRRKHKHGFGLPFGLWLTQHGPLREFAFDSLNQLRRRAIVRGEFIDTLQGPLLHAHPAYHGTMVWLLMMLEQWLQAHPALAVSTPAGGGRADGIAGLSTFTERAGSAAAATKIPGSLGATA